jgi:hypothetical protein
MKISEITVQELFYNKEDYQEKNRDIKPIKEYGGESKFNVDVDGDVYQYHNFLDQDDDTEKYFHFVRPPGAAEVEMDWSPWTEPSPKEIKLWIKLGMPQRQDMDSRGPINGEMLVHYARSKGIKI